MLSVSLIRTARYPSPPVDDTSSLETDTMRFLAILSICLMIIFALIESIPPSETEVPVAVEQPAELEHTAEQLKEEIDRLNRKASELAHHLELLVADVEKKVQEFDLLSQQSDAKRAALREHQERLEAALMQTQMVEDRLAVQEEKLRRVTVRLQSRQQELSTSGRQLQAVKTALTVEDNRLDALKSRVEPASRARVPDSPEKPKEPLTLRFESTAALENLVRRRQIRLFAQLGGNFWESTPALAFTKGESPGQAYLITGSVGDRLTKSFRRQAGLLTSRAPEWWVVFDDALGARIAALAQQNRHGTLLISANGSVSHTGG